MIPAPFEYSRPATVEEALELLDDPEAMVLAGGHSLLPMMKLRLARPERLVDIARLDFHGITEAAGELRIGALTTYDELLRHDGPLPDALREAAASVGDRQVRNAGTIGGALAHGDPGSDLAAAAIALDGRMQLRSLAGTREVPADGFFLGPYSTAISQQELVVELIVPLAQAGEASAYVSIEDAASGYPLAGVAARTRGGSWSLALTGVGAHPAPIAGLEQGVPSVEAARAALGEPDRNDPDGEYRLELAAVVAARACAAARARLWAVA